MKKILVFALATLIAGMSTFADWLYTVSGKNSYIEEVGEWATPWKFAVTVANGNELSLSSRSVNNPDNKVVDLNTPITDESGNPYYIVALGTGTGLFGKVGTATITELTLPSTLKKVTGAGNAFDTFKGKIYLPEDIQLESVPASCFTSSGLSGNVVLMNATSIGNNAFKSCSGITRIEFGPSILNVPNAALYYCSGITNFIVHAEEPFTVSTAESMRQAKNIRRFEFPAYPSIGPLLSTGGGSYGTNTRIYVLKSKWTSVLNGDKFTKWADCPVESAKAGDVSQATFINAFGDAEEPLGYTTDPMGAWLIALPEEASATATLTVQGNPAEYGTPVPEYGTTPDITETTMCTISQYHTAGAVLWEAKGWKAESIDPETFDKTGETSGDGREYEFVVTGNEMVKLTWNWEIVGRQVSLADVPSDCSIVANTAPNLEGFYSIGTTVSYTAVGDDFVSWAGVPAEVTDPTARTIEFTIGDSPVALTACFMRPWTYDATAKTISNGYAVFGVSDAGANRLALASLKTKGAMPSCDLRLPITGTDGASYSLVSISGVNGLFYKNSAYESLYLPSSLEAIAANAFESTSKMAVYIPEDNAITSLGGSAFNGSSVRGNLVLLKCSALGGSVFKSQGSIQSVVLGPNVTEIGLACFYQCVGMVRFEERSKTFSIGQQALEQCRGLKEMRLACYPTFGPSWNSQVPLGKQFRVIAPIAGNVDWSARTSDEAIEAKEFVPWKSCSKADHDTYYATFGADAARPRGYTTQPFAAWLVEAGEPATILMLK